MSEPTRDDLRIKCECDGGTIQTDWGTDQCPRCSSAIARLLEPGEFEAIVDADPRWVRRAEFDKLSDGAQRLSEQIVRFQRHWVQVTRDCDGCGGKRTVTGCVHFAPGMGAHAVSCGTTKDWPCPDCVDGKVPADGVFKEWRCDAPSYAKQHGGCLPGDDFYPHRHTLCRWQWEVPVEGSDDE